MFLWMEIMIGYFITIHLWDLLEGLCRKLHFLVLHLMHAYLTSFFQSFNPFYTHTLRASSYFYCKVFPSYNKLLKSCFPFLRNLLKNSKEQLCSYKLVLNSSAMLPFRSQPFSFKINRQILIRLSRCQIFLQISKCTKKFYFEFILQFMQSKKRLLFFSVQIHLNDRA